MPLSLKKQIFQNKVENFIKTHPIILFFAIFDLPQTTRGQLKKQIKCLLESQVSSIEYCLSNPPEKYSKEKPCYPQSSASKVHGASSNGHALAPLGQVPLLEDVPVNAPLGAKQSKSSNALWSKKEFIFSTLHIKNKCFQNLSKCHKLPLYGQTLVIAFRNEEDLSFLPQFLSSYKAILVGGFYKKVPETPKYFMALSKKTINKVQVYGECLNTLSVNIRNYHRTCNALPIKCLQLLNYISKQVCSSGASPSGMLWKSFAFREKNI